MNDGDSQEKMRVMNLYRIEDECYTSGAMSIAGVDEAGRGPLAGPVVASAVILKPHTFLAGLNDSKLVGEKQRERLYAEIAVNAIAVGIGEIGVDIIDTHNILQATKIAMKSAIANLGVSPDFLLIDAVSIDINISQKSIIKGDQKSASIAAASIVAKVYRDKIMRALDQKYPQYGFAAHKGYGTKEHLRTLSLFGPSPVHRRSFAPVKMYAK